MLDVWRSKTAVDRDDLSSDEARLYKVVPAEGGTVSNPSAQAALGLSDAEYWRVRDALVDKGRIVRGRGRGGTLRRVIDSPVSETVNVPVSVTTAPDPAGQVEAAVRRELQLYDPIATVLQGDWARDRRASPLAVEITALQGRRATGGTWSRPDMVSVEIKTYAFVPGKYLEVITFEVKPCRRDQRAGRVRVPGPSTLCHTLLRLAARSVAQATALAETIDDLRVVARSHGIGVITVGEPADYNTCDELEEAQRFEPDPERLDQFIVTKLSDRTKTKIARGLR